MICILIMSDIGGYPIRMIQVAHEHVVAFSAYSLLDLKKELFLAELI